MSAKQYTHMFSGGVLSCECSTRPQVSDELLTREIG